MQRIRNILVALGTLALIVAPAFAQTPTGTLNGRVTSQDGEPLPGVTVTATSPSLQGSRVVVTSNNGDYHLPFLPPGRYALRFELEGLATVEEEARVSLGQTATRDAQMSLEEIREEIVVTGELEGISGTSQSAVTYSQDFVEKLPVLRNITQATLLSPAAGSTGPSGNVSISGNMSFENLYLVNGVVITDNIRATPFDLFIEDAVEETTVSSSGISAEYGRFSGGVINTITKSGGNEFHGSLRASLDSEKWEGETPLTVERDDTENTTYEGTLGGRLWRDHIWFFLAARDRDEEGIGQTAEPTSIPFDAGNPETRLEGKLTFSPTPSHRLVGTYLEIDEEQQGNFFGTVLDLESLNDRKVPQELTAFHYSGVLTPNFFVEGQYSEREFLFQDSGSKFTDLIRGTLFVDLNGRRWNSPTFCGVCRDEERSNENLLLKASYFLSTPALGSHNIVVGYDTFEDIRAADNHQSGSDFRIVDVETITQGSGPDTVLFPHFIPGETTFIQWNPIFETTRGTAFKTNSLFVNDQWRLNNRLSLNLGIRYDENDGDDAGGNKVVDDSKVSPRIGATYDVHGDGEMQVHASFGRFVSAVANSQAGAGSAAGSPATITWFYEGPEINGPGSSLIPAPDALQMLWDWFDSIGGTNNTDFRSISIPGGATVVGDDMKSPHTDEYSLGFSQQLGTRGLVRSDYVHREGGDFYIDRRDLNTGQAVLPTGTAVDKSVIGNEDARLERVYDGLHTQGRYRFTDRLEVGGTWAWSHTRGTWNGETVASGPVRSALGNYPEYKTFDQHLVRGDLENDQRHRARLWASWDLLEIGGNRLNLAVLQNFASGTPYGASGGVDTRPFVSNPGYVTPPSSVTYFFTSRDEFRTDDITRTDLALNYSFDWNTFGKSLEVFLQPEVINLFNEDGVEIVNTSVRDATNFSGLEPFNPFTDTPVEGVHWEKGPDFGQPSSPADFQDPRTFRFSVGFRF